MRASNTEHKNFLSKTLTFLLKHLPVKQEKADSTMKGEMIMSSLVNEIQSTEQVTQIDCQGVLEFSMEFQTLTPLHLQEPTVGVPSRQR